MNLVSLDLAKAHLRVTHDAEDELINLCIASASEYVQEYIAYRFKEGDEIPSMVKSACLLDVGTLYKQRENDVIGTIHTDTGTITRLLRSYRTDLSVVSSPDKEALEAAAVQKFKASGSGD